MNRMEYMERLERKLKRLPKEDYDKAISYFEEYFEEAGAENEVQAIEDLGEPDLAADQIIRDFAQEYAARPERNVKKSFSGVWVAVLALFAAPIGLPLAFAAGCLGLALVVAVAAVLFAVFMVTLSFVLLAVPGFFVSIWLIFTSPLNGIATLGMVLITAGIGIWTAIGCVALCRRFLHLATRLFGRAARGGRGHEK